MSVCTGAPAKVNFSWLSKSDTEPYRFRFPSTRERRGSQTDFYCISCHQDGTKVRCAYLRHALARPERHSRLTTVCKPPQRRPNATSLFAHVIYSRAKGQAISAGPLSSLGSGPSLIVKLYFGWLSDRFLDIPDALSASTRHYKPPSYAAKGHDSRGSPYSGNSHVFGRPCSHSFATMPKMCFLLSQVNPVLGQEESKH